jgi:hypothetical protein
MATPAKSRTGLYIGLGAVGAGAYYLYRAGGNPKAAKEEMKCKASPLYLGRSSPSSNLESL